MQVRTWEYGNTKRDHITSYRETVGSKICVAHGMSERSLKYLSSNIIRREKTKECQDPKIPHMEIVDDVRDCVSDQIEKENDAFHLSTQEHRPLAAKENEDGIVAALQNKMENEADPNKRHHLGVLLSDGLQVTFEETRQFFFSGDSMASEALYPYGTRGNIPEPPRHRPNYKQHQQHRYLQYRSKRNKRNNNNSSNNPPQARQDEDVTSRSPQLSSVQPSAANSNSHEPILNPRFL
jgi:hypothetical protein